MFKQQEFGKKQEDVPSAVEVKEKGGFSYVELNEKQSPAGERLFCDLHSIIFIMIYRGCSF